MKSIFIQSQRETQPQGSEGAGYQAALLLQNGQFSQSYLLLSQIIQENAGDVAARFNMGLCLLQSGLAAQALPHLDEGLAALHTGGLENAPPAQQLFLQVEQAQASGYTYKAAMLPFEVQLFPRQCKHRFLQLIVDACMHTGAHQRVRQIAASLQNKPYANIQDAISKIENT